jgi:outer membrane protein TolC
MGLSGLTKLSDVFSLSYFNTVQQSKAARLPQLSLTGNIGGSSNALSDITDPANVTWQLLGNLLAPIFDGGVRRAQVDIATAEQKQALAAYGQSALKAFSEVETNLDLANTLVQRKQELNVALSEAEKAYKIAQLRYKEGEIALIDLLAIQQRVLTAKSNQSFIQRLALEQRINLYLALGGDW